MIVSLAFACLYTLLIHISNFFKLTRNSRIFLFSSGTLQIFVNCQRQTYWRNSKHREFWTSKLNILPRIEFMSCSFSESSVNLSNIGQLSGNNWDLMKIIAVNNELWKKIKNAGTTYLYSSRSIHICRTYIECLYAEGIKTCIILFKVLYIIAKGFVHAAYMKKY